MRKSLLTAFLFIAALTCSAQQLKVGFGQIIPLASSTSTPVAWTNANVWVRSVTILGKKAERTDNTGTVYIGPISTNDKQPFPVLAGGEVILEAAPGCLINLADWYVDSTSAGDGVVLIYQ